MRPRTSSYIMLFTWTWSHIHLDIVIGYLLTCTAVRVGYRPYPANHEMHFKCFNGFISVSDVSLRFETCYMHLLCVSIVVILTHVSLKRFLCISLKPFWDMSYETFLKHFRKVSIRVSFVCIVRFKNTLVKMLFLQFQMRYSETFCRMFQVSLKPFLNVSMKPQSETVLKRVNPFHLYVRLSYNKTT